MRGRRFVRPALILWSGDGSERRLLAELDDKPWAAEDGESWRAAFAVDSEEALEQADRVELSVAPDVNIALRAGGETADGPIWATGRVSEEPPAAGGRSTAPSERPSAGGSAGSTPQASAGGSAGSTPQTSAAGSAGVAAQAPAAGSAASGPRATAASSDAVAAPAPRRRRARGVPSATPRPLVAEPLVTEPAVAEPAAAQPAVVRPRLAQNRAVDIDRLTTKLRTAEAALEREQARRESAEQSLERERSETRRTVAELARTRAELELARTAERESADTISQLDASRRDNHELRARHEALRADHDRVLRAHAELEEALEARTTALQTTREELAGERQQRREAESRANAAIEAAVESGHRPPVIHATPHNPPLPRTDRPLNPSLRQNVWLRALVVLVLLGVLLAVYLVLHSTVLH